MSQNEVPDPTTDHELAPADEGGVLKLSAFFPYRLNVLASLVSEGLAKIYFDRFGINIPAWRVLVTVAEFGKITPSAVAKHSFMTKVKVTRAVALLEDMGLICRATNAEDNREIHLTLSDKGLAVFRQIEPLAISHSNRLMSVFSEGERIIFSELVARLTESARSTDHLSTDEGWDEGGSR